MNLTQQGIFNERLQQNTHINGDPKYLFLIYEFLAFWNVYNVLDTSIKSLISHSKFSEFPKALTEELLLELLCY